MKWWLGILTGIVALMLAVLLAAYFNGVPYSHNTATLLISVLGVIVTALVGWQVFNAVENSKTLRKLDRLENRLRTQIDVHEKWNNEIFDMIEAEMAIREADKTTDYATKYFNYAKALALYLRGNVDVSHSFIKTKIPYLSTIISQVERSNNDDKILFARQMSGLDDLHETLLDIISDREEDLKAMRREVIDLRTRRNNLFGKFVGLETSVERLIREEDAKRKAKAAHNPPS